MNVPSAVWLSRLRGRRLTKPRKLLGKLSFQVRLVADPETPRRLYLTWLKADDVSLYQFSNTGNPISFIRTDDGGRNWTRRVRVSSPRRERVIAPSLERMNAIPEAEALGPDGSPTPVLEAAVAQVKRNVILELGFFAVIFTCMILMRFGI